MLVTDQETIQTYYQALVDKNPQFVGIFYVGVKTTSVCCIATCRARKPKFENVEFFTTFADALNHGHRPCKICKPTENSTEAPDEIKQAVALVRTNPKQKITDFLLKQHGIQPEKVRRWFNAHYGMTFQKLQRMYRINNALIELKDGTKIIDSALDNGYESLSVFAYTYKQTLGKSPKHYAHNEPILLSRLTTPIGPMFVCATSTGVCLVEFVDRRMLETEFKDLQNKLKTTILIGENEHTQLAKKELTAYFAGQLRTFTVPLHTPETEFQQQVWKGLQAIPFGKTSTYQQQAENIGRPTATRAVANANGCNRVAIIIPCHRVIGKDGSLTGYGGGLERKRWWLEHESK